MRTHTPTAHDSADEAATTPRQIKGSATLLMLSADELRDLVTEAVREVVGSAAKLPKEQSLEQPEWLTLPQAMQELGYRDRRAFIAALPRLGLHAFQPSPRKTFFDAADIAHAKTLRRPYRIQHYIKHSR